MLPVSVDIFSHSMSLLILSFSHVFIIVRVLDVLERFFLLYSSFGRCEGKELAL